MTNTETQPKKETVGKYFKFYKSGEYVFLTVKNDYNIIFTTDVKMKDIKIKCKANRFNNSIYNISIYYRNVNIDTTIFLENPHINSVQVGIRGV